MDLNTLDRSLQGGAKRLLEIVWRRKSDFLVVSTGLFLSLSVCILALTPIYEGSTLLWVSKAEMTGPVDSSSSRPEANASLVRIAESEEVISDAIERIGLSKLSDSASVTATSSISSIREALFNWSDGPHTELARVQAAFANLSDTAGATAEAMFDVGRKILFDWKDRQHIELSRVKSTLAELSESVVETESSLVAAIREAVFNRKSIRHVAFSPIQSALPKIKDGISVRAEPNSDVIRLAYRNKDPEAATEFVNALAQAFIERRLALVSTPGAVAFFKRQKERFDDEFRVASDRLQKFSIVSATYSADDQRQLLLKRMNDLKLALAVTQSSVSEKTGQRQALAAELRKLAPVARSTYVSSLIDSLSDDDKGGSPTASGAPMLADRSVDPPLLLVKVYQDSMAKLFQLNADLAGAELMEKQQSKQIVDTMSQLDKLAEDEKQFMALRQAVAQASFNSTLYSRRMVEEEIAMELNAERFSSVRVLQPGGIPIQPVFPNYLLMFLINIIFSASMGTVAAIYKDSQRIGEAGQHFVTPAQV